MQGILTCNALQLPDGSLALYELIAVGNHSCEPNCEIIGAQIVRESGPLCMLFGLCARLRAAVSLVNCQGSCAWAVILCLSRVLFGWC